VADSIYLMASQRSLGQRHLRYELACPAAAMLSRTAKIKVGWRTRADRTPLLTLCGFKVRPQASDYSSRSDQQLAGKSSAKAANSSGIEIWQLG